MQRNDWLSSLGKEIKCSKWIDPSPAERFCVLSTLSRQPSLPDSTQNTKDYDLDYDLVLRHAAGPSCQHDAPVRDFHRCQHEQGQFELQRWFLT